MNRTFWWLFVVACWIGIFQLLHPVSYGFGPGFEMATIARNLAANGVYGNPFPPAITGPTAVVPPLYPFFLSLFFRFFSAPFSGLLPTVVNILTNALIAALMPRLSVLMCGRLAPGVFAGILWLFVLRLMPQWDAAFTLAALVLFAVLTADSMARSRATAGTAVVAGLATGIISLANPASVLVCAPWVLFLLILHHFPVRIAVRYLAIFGLAAALCNLPWMIRNYGIWHAFALRTNFGMTIYSSNNDCAQSSLFKNARSGCYAKTHPVASETEITRLEQVGEVQFDRERTAATIAWIRSHPDRFRELTLARIVEFWFPDPQEPTYTFHAIWAITVLAIPGLFLMARDRLPIAWCVLALWLVYPPMYYIVVSCDRYRYPILWTSLLPAGYFLATIFSPRQVPVPPASPRDSR